MSQRNHLLCVRPQIKYLGAPRKLFISGNTKVAVSLRESYITFTSLFAYRSNSFMVRVCPHNSANTKTKTNIRTATCLKYFKTSHMEGKIWKGNNHHKNILQKHTNTIRYTA